MINAKLFQVISWKKLAEHYMNFVGLNFDIWMILQFFLHIGMLYVLQNCSTYNAVHINLYGTFTTLIYPCNHLYWNIIFLLLIINITRVYCTIHFLWQI